MKSSMSRRNWMSSFLRDHLRMRMIASYSSIRFVDSPQDNETVRLDPVNRLDPGLDFENSGSEDVVNSLHEAFKNISLAHETPFDNTTRNVIIGFIVVICVLGLVGNGMTIYILANSIKRNSFITFILNLSIADFAVLTSLIIATVVVSLLGKKTDIINIISFLIFELFFFTYSASQFLLTAISLDRCVAVLFPLWHRCHRPPYLSTLVCVLIWILSFLLSAVHFILHQTSSSESSPLLFQLIVNGLLCTPIMIVSTVTLLIQMKSKSQRNQRKLLSTILLALLCFLLFSLPMNVFYVIEYFCPHCLVLMTIGIGCASLNSSINPLLYYLVGRKNKRKEQPRASYKVALQRVFKDEQANSEDQGTSKEDKL